MRPMARIARAGAMTIGFSAFAVSRLQGARSKISDAGQGLADLVSTPEEVFRKRHGMLRCHLAYSHMSESEPLPSFPQHVNFLRAPAQMPLICLLRRLLVDFCSAVTVPTATLG